MSALTSSARVTSARASPAYTSTRGPTTSWRSGVGVPGHERWHPEPRRVQKGAPPPASASGGRLCLGQRRVVAAGALRMRGVVVSGIHRSRRRPRLFGWVKKDDCGWPFPRRATGAPAGDGALGCGGAALAPASNVADHERDAPVDAYPGPGGGHSNQAAAPMGVLYPAVGSAASGAAYGGLDASAGSRRFTRPWLGVLRLAMHAPTSSQVSTSRRPSISRCSAEASQWPKAERDQDMPTRLEDDGLAGGSRLRIGHERHVAGLADAHDQRPAGPVVLVEQVMRLDAVTGQVV